VEARLEVDQQPLTRFSFGIVDSGYGTVDPGPGRSGASIDAQRVELDPDPEVDPYLADRVAEILEMRLGVLTGIADSTAKPISPAAREKPLAGKNPIKVRCLLGTR
jgi:hypothetical protein